jgi:phage shock protein A
MRKAGVAVTNPEDVLEDAWYRLADECLEAVRAHHHLINQLSQVGLLSSPAATALTANTDQLEAKAAEIRRRHPSDQASPVRQPDW